MDRSVFNSGSMGRSKSQSNSWELIEWNIFSISCITYPGGRNPKSKGKLPKNMNYSAWQCVHGAWSPAPPTSSKGQVKLKGLKCSGLGTRAKWTVKSQNTTKPWATSLVKPDIFLSYCYVFQGTSLVVNIISSIVLGIPQYPNIFFGGGIRCSHTRFLFRVGYVAPNHISLWGGICCSYGFFASLFLDFLKFNSFKKIPPQVLSVHVWKYRKRPSL